MRATELPHASTPGLIHAVFTGRFIHFLETCEQRFGAYFNLGPAPKTYLVCASADGANQILRQKKDCFTKGPAYDPLRLYMGDGLLTAEYETWRVRKRHIAPVYERQDIDTIVHVARDSTNQLLLDIAAEGRPFDWHACYTDIVLKTMSQCFLDIDPTRIELENLRHALEHVTQRGTRFIRPPLWLPLPRNLRFLSGRRAIYRFIDRWYAGAKTIHPPSDFAQSCRHIASDAKQSDSQIRGITREEITTLLYAGFETTTLTLTWMMYFLHRHPEVRDRLAAEISAVPNQDDNNAKHVLAAMPFTRQVLCETLRYCGAPWGIPRQVRQDVEIEGIYLAAGSQVVISPHLIHRSARYWRHPMTFNPDRFGSTRIQSEHRFRFMPFSLGERMCIGRSFAMTEMLAIALELISRFEFHTIDDGGVSMLAPGAIQPSRPIRGTISLKHTATTPQPSSV